jgi:YHS domain-containing protein
MKKILMIAGMGLLMAMQGFAQKATVFNSNGIAIHGYDPVAFFTENKPEKGKEQFSYKWQDVNWLFATKENLESFKAMPEKYAPQYGGYCAYGTAAGHKAPTETDTWTIVGDKLYFNYNKNVKALWLKDQKNFIEKADKNWPGIKDKE